MSWRAIAIVFIAACATFTGAEARIERSSVEVLAFKRHNPCPVTGLRSGACPGHQVDHANPICAGGSDTRDNMQWLTTEEHRMKTRSDLRMCRLHRSK